VDVELSFFDLLKAGSFETSLITTYNAFLPFYEEVVLRKLMAIGCRHNVVLMDNAEWAKCLADPPQRPRLAGYDYTLVPMKAGGSFHPKIIVLLGKKKGIAVIGSHNLTLAGFGCNRELTNTITVESQTDAEGIHIIKTIQDFLQAWLAQQDGHVPSDILDAVTKVWSFAPWLSKKGSASQTLGFLGAYPDGASLWEQLRSSMPPLARRVIVVGAFFDKAFTFLHTVQEELKPSELVVGIEPETVHISPDAADLERMRFVNANCLYTQKGYLHAKAMYIEADGQHDMLITGSANPSAPAWLAGKHHRNAEAMIVRAGPEARQTAQCLGLTSLVEKPSVQPATWNEIATRVTEAQGVPERASRPSALAVEVQAGFSIPCPGMPLTSIQDVQCLNEHLDLLSTVSQVSLGHEGLTIPCEPGVRSAVRYLVVHFGNGLELFALVHHTYTIENRARSDRQAQFREAFATISSDNPDLVRLMGIIEKIIFDDEAPLIARQSRKGKSSEERQDEGSRELGPFAVRLDDTNKQRSNTYRRLVEAGDLGHILDVLIHHLGVGLWSTGQPVDAYGRSEEEQIGADDEAPPEVPAMADLIPLCHRKVRTLITRMLNKLAQAAQQDAHRIAALVQLVAVLAMVRELRSLDHKAPWVPKGETLVPPKERQRLFHGALAHVFGRQDRGKKERLFDAALREIDHEPAEEIARLHGLLVWLAWDSDVALREIHDLRLSWEERQQRTYDKARLLAIVPHTAVDPVAIQEARDSILHATRVTQHQQASNWLRVNLEWGQKITHHVTCLSDVRGASEAPEIGDTALAPDALPRIVTRATGRSIWLCDLNEKEPEIGYLTSRVTKLPV